MRAHVAKLDLPATLSAAFAEAKAAAENAGAVCTANWSGTSPETAHGDSRQIQALITRFAGSLQEVAEDSAVEVRATIGNPAEDILPLKLEWSLTSAAPTLPARLNAIAAGSTNLQAAQMGTAEAGLAAAWQLALTLGGAPKIVTNASGQWQVEVVLPVALTSPDYKNAAPGVGLPPAFQQLAGRGQFPTATTNGHLPHQNAPAGKR